MFSVAHVNTRTQRTDLSIFNSSCLLWFLSELGLITFKREITPGWSFCLIFQLFLILSREAAPQITTNNVWCCGKHQVCPPYFLTHPHYDFCLRYCCWNRKRISRILLHVSGWPDKPCKLSLHRHRNTHSSRGYVRRLQHRADTEIEIMLVSMSGADHKNNHVFFIIWGW